MRSWCTLGTLLTMSNATKPTAQNPLIWNMAAGTFLAWELARLTGSRHPYLGPLSVILCLKPTADQSAHFALQRVGGTLLGILLMTWAAPHLPLNGWVLGLSLLLGTGIAKALKLSDAVIHEVALSLLLVFYFERHAPGYGFDRAKDTMIGAGVGALLMALTAPARPARP
jgi:uncharacterized membrane protein YgaE (UPF0421/DUF939 family)